jgi:hypothetical protein
MAWDLVVHLLDYKEFHELSMRKWSKDSLKVSYNRKERDKNAPDKS